MNRLACPSMAHPGGISFFPFINSRIPRLRGIRMDGSNSEDFAAGRSGLIAGGVIVTGTPKRGVEGGGCFRRAQMRFAPGK